MTNTGQYNAGSFNTGSFNTGHHNVGDYNAGGHNVGNNNAGSCNTGQNNTGSRNAGHDNVGHYNTGNFNIGRRNTGHYNTSNHHTGFFNTKPPEKVYCFNRPVDYYDFTKAEFPEYLKMISLTTWITSEDMTDQEKQDNPSHGMLGGYLRKNDLKQEYRKAFEQATPEDIELTKELPAFDPEVFLEITGVDLREDQPKEDQPKKEIVIDGVVYVRKDG